MQTLLSSPHLEEVLLSLSGSDTSREIGQAPSRQPVHTVFGGAHHFKIETVGKTGQLALHYLSEYTPDFIEFAHAFRLPASGSLATGGEIKAALLRAADRSLDSLRTGHMGAWLAASVHKRVDNKLRLQPVEDYRIDFEDGFGVRSDEEEDQEAERVAREIGQGVSESLLPPFFGVRIKPLDRKYARRAVRTLDILVTETLKTTGGELPDNFTVALPQVVDPGQVTALARVLDQLETSAGLPDGKIRIELTIETADAFRVEGGTMGVTRFVDAGGGRCRSVHFAAHDYLASLGVAPSDQTPAHPACEYARRTLQTALFGSGVSICDGSTRRVPVEPHKTGAYATLTAEQVAQNRESVHRAWRAAYDDAMRSLHGGLFQGADVHPAQLPARFAAVYTYFLKELDGAASFLNALLERSGKTGVVGDTLIDTATGQSLLNYFSKAVKCGAITVDEALRSGLTMDELKWGSFRDILEKRAAAEKNGQAANMRTSPYSQSTS